MLETKRGTKWEILQRLRKVGETTLQELKDEIDLSPSTLNEHLSDLQARGLVDKRSERDGPGRPHYVYFLTEDAEHLFPHAYSELATILLDVIRSLASESEARDKIASAMKRHIKKYDDLEAALTALGFYPDIEEQEDGSRTLTYHQCPFYDVAKNDPTLCCIDRAVLEDLNNGSVEMEESIAEGAGTCRFVLSEN